MKQLHTLTILLFMLFVDLVYAQDDEKLPSFFSTENEFTTTQLPVLINGADYLQVNSNSKATTLQSSIYLQQIGEKNEVFIQSQTKTSQLIIQKGDVNNYLYKDYQFDPAIKLGVLQHGNDNFLKIHGANSIINNAKIIQSGGAQITITSF